LAQNNNGYSVTNSTDFAYTGYISGSNIANHAWSYEPCIKLILAKARYNRQGKLPPQSYIGILAHKAHCAHSYNADNNSKHLPEQYRFLLKK
jgi:hypothetical protein